MRRMWRFWPLRTGGFALAAWGGKRREQGRRPPFEFVIPRLVAPGVDIKDVVLPLWDQLRQRTGAPIHYMFPDTRVQDWGKGVGVHTVDSTTYAC